MVKMMLLKTIESFMEEAIEERNKCMERELYGAANYTDGKVAAYKAVLEILYLIKEDQIPFTLD